MSCVAEGADGKIRVISSTESVIERSGNDDFAKGVKLKNACLIAMNRKRFEPGQRNNKLRKALTRGVASACG